MLTSSTKKKPFPLKSILKKSIGNSSSSTLNGENEIGLGMYQTQDRNSTSLEYRSPEGEDEELSRRRDEEEIEEQDSPIEGRHSRLSDFQLPGSESFYGESLLGLGFDNLESPGEEAEQVNVVEPRASYFRPSTYIDSPTIPEEIVVETRSELSNSARAKFEQSMRLVSNSNFEAEELEMRRLAELILGNAGILETNSSDEEGDEMSGSPFSISFENLSIYNYLPEEEDFIAPGTGSTSNYTEGSSRNNSISYIKTPPLTSGCSSIISLPPISPQFSPPVLQSHPDSPQRDFKFNQSFSSINLPRSPPLPSILSDSTKTLPGTTNERRFSQSAQVEEVYTVDDISPLTNYAFPEAASIQKDLPIKTRPPPLSLVLESIKNDDLPTPHSATTPTSTNHLLSPTSDTSTPSLVLASSTGSASSILTPIASTFDLEEVNPKSTTETKIVPDFFDIISDIKGIDRIPGYNHANLPRPNKIPPLSAELVASLSSSSSSSTLRKKPSNLDLSKSLPPSSGGSSSQPSSPTFPNSPRARNFSEPIIPIQSIIAFPIFVPTPTTSSTKISPASIPAPISPVDETTPLPLPLPPTLSTPTRKSSVASTESSNPAQQQNPISFQPLPMNSPSQVVIGSPQGTYSPNGEPFAVWGSLAEDFRKEEEEVASSVGMSKGLSTSSSNRDGSRGTNGTGEEEEEEDDQPLAKKPGALKLQKSLRELKSSSGGKKLRKNSDSNHSGNSSSSSNKLEISNPISQDPSKPIIPRSMMMDGLDDIPLASLASKFGNNGLTSSSDELLQTPARAPPPRPQRSPLEASTATLGNIATSPTLSERQIVDNSGRDSSLSRTSNHSGSQSGVAQSTSRSIGSQALQNRSRSNSSTSNQHHPSLHHPHQNVHPQHNQTQHHHQIPLQHHHLPPPSLAHQQTQIQHQPPQPQHSFPSGPPPRRPSRSADLILSPVGNMSLKSQLDPSSRRPHSKSPTSANFPLPVQQQQQQELNSIPHSSTSSSSILSTPPVRKLSILPIPDSTSNSISDQQPSSPPPVSALSSSTSPVVTPAPTFSKPITSSAPPTTTNNSNNDSSQEHRIFILDHSTHFVVKVSPATRCGEIVMGAKNRGLLTAGTEAEGGFALWEICRGLGVERAIREFESLADVIASWNNEVNILVIRRTTLSPLLSVYAKSPKVSVSKSASVQLRMKGKWSKRYLELKNGAVFHSKSENGKDFTLLCQLSAFDVFYVAKHSLDNLKAPKPFVLALKSLLPRVHYEDAADYCYYVSVKTDVDLQAWMAVLTEARNVFVRQREQVLINQRAEAGIVSPTTSPVKLLDNIPTPQPRNNPPPPLSRPVDPPTLSQTQPHAQLSSSQSQSKSQPPPQSQPLIPQTTSKLPTYIHPQFQTKPQPISSSSISNKSDNDSIRKLGSQIAAHPIPPPSGVRFGVNTVNSSGGNAFLSHANGRK